MNPFRNSRNQLWSHKHITSKRNKLSIAQHNMYLGKATAQNPSISIFHMVKIMKQYTSLSPLRNLCTLRTISLWSCLNLAWNLRKIGQVVNIFLPLLDLPSLHILGIILPLLIRKISINGCTILQGLPDDLMHDLYNFLIVQLIDLFP